MINLILVILAYVAVGTFLAVLIGKSINLADRRELPPKTHFDPEMLCERPPPEPDLYGWLDERIRLTGHDEVLATLPPSIAGDFRVAPPLCRSTNHEHTRVTDGAGTVIRRYCGTYVSSRSYALEEQDQS